MSIEIIDGCIYDFAGESGEIISPYEETVKSDEVAIFYHCLEEYKNE